MRKVFFAVGSALLLALLYTRLLGAEAYTLYRNSAADRNAAGHSAMRLQVATLDAKYSGQYNQENCD